MRLLPSDPASDLSSAADALRQANQKYRDALISGDFSAALRAKEAQLAAEVRLDQARWLIEG